MKDKPLFDLENQFEADLIAQVLKDHGIPYRIAPWENSYWGILFGEGVLGMHGYAKLWGYDKDKEKIADLLDQVRASRPIDDFSVIDRPRKWRIKKLNKEND